MSDEYTKYNVSKDRIQEFEQDLEKFFKRHLTGVSVKAVSSDEVAAYKSSNYDDNKHRREYEVYYLLKTNPLDKQEIIETRGSMYEHIKYLLNEMESSTQLPDTIMDITNHPPEHIKNKKLHFYLRCVM